MKKLFIVELICLLFAIMGLSGCIFSTATTCAVESTVSTAVAAAVSSPVLLNCNSQGLSVIQGKIQSLLDSKGVCKVQGGLIGSSVCPLVEAEIMSLIKAQMPTGCNPVVPLTALTGVASAACALIPF